MSLLLLGLIVMAVHSTAATKTTTKVGEYLALFANPGVLEYLPYTRTHTRTHTHLAQCWLSSLSPVKVSICIMQHSHPQSHMTLYQERRREKTLFLVFKMNLLLGQTFSSPLAQQSKPNSRTALSQCPIVPQNVSIKAKASTNVSSPACLFGDFLFFFSRLNID